MISRVALEPVGDKLLLRVAAENASLDILTDASSLARARALVRAPQPRFTELRLGSFGPFPVTLSVDATGHVAIAVDGPDLGPTVRGNQAAVFYPTPAEAAELFRVELDAPAT